jgi:hypothetical protein
MIQLLKSGHIAACAAALFFIASAWAQTDLVTNGQFASGLAGWNFSVSTTGSAAGTCGYNFDIAPGHETLTLTPGFPATGGATNIALGSISLTATGFQSCVLYQDIAIPPGATTARFSLDHGIKLVGGINQGDQATFMGLYSTATVPNFPTPVLVPGSQLINAAPSATLVTLTSGPFNVSAFAGTTVRLAIINAMQSLAGGTGPPVPGAGAVIGVLNVHLTVNATPVVTGVSPTSGPTTGGTAVTITGSNFTGATAVRFGTTAATSFTVVNDTTITATSPAHAGGALNVTVTSPGGTSATGAANQFTFSTGGGTGIPILGAPAMTMRALLLAAVGYLSARRGFA